MPELPNDDPSVMEFEFDGPALLLPKGVLLKVLELLAPKVFDDDAPAVLLLPPPNGFEFALALLPPLNGFVFWEEAGFPNGEALLILLDPKPP